VTFLRRWLLASAGFLALELATRPPAPAPAPARVAVIVPPLPVARPRPMCLCSVCERLRSAA
jgi:hypothetical protein